MPFSLYASDRQLEEAVTSLRPASHRIGPASIPGQVMWDFWWTVALEQVSTDYGFPCQFLFHQILHNRLSSGAGIIGQLLADVPNGLSITSQKKRQNKLKPIVMYME
jgi:hypothetical protein